jgi:hypothetical protein
VTRGNGHPVRGSRPGWLPSGRFFAMLRWIDRRPLTELIEPYRARLFTEFLDARERVVQGDGSVVVRPRYNLGLFGRAKKNAKSLDLVLASLFALIGN